MDDSDDYVYDDFVLDEQTLAALDQAEQNYQNSLSKSSGHTAKRHKTEEGWKAGLGTNDDFDDLPEISVRNDGSYSIRSRPKAKEIHAVSSGSSSSKHHPHQKDFKPLIPPPCPIMVMPSDNLNKFNKQIGEQSKLEKELKELQRNLEEVSIFSPSL